MKKAMYFRQFFVSAMIISSIIFSITSCSEEKNEPDVKSASIKVKVSMPEEYDSMSLKNVSVSLKNINSSKIITTKTDANGICEFNNLSVDNYELNCSLKLSPKEYNKISGYNATDSVLFTGSVTPISLSPDEKKDITVPLRTNSSSGLVIKTIYYAGSDRNKAAGTYDSFIEIYNNSNQVIYADSLCISFLVNTRYGSHPTKQDAKYYYQSNGRYDWSKCEGMPSDINANKDYFYATTLYMIPGNGKQYKIKAGESIIIATFAQNFKASFIDYRGEKHTPESPELTVDLSKAEFECIYEKTKELDNPSVPNLNIIHPGNMKWMNFDSSGKESYLIFRHPNPSKLPIYLIPAKNPKRSSKERYVQIPTKYAIDAVEVITPNSDGYLAPKVLDPEFDAGYAYSKGETYSSNCITRKTAKVLKNGRRILQDVNNSTNDFVSIKANPKGFAN